MRRAPAEVRKIEPDPVYRSVLVSQVINKVLLAWQEGCGSPHRLRLSRNRAEAHRR